MHVRMQLAPGTRRAVVLSGMSGSEVQEVVSAYADSGAHGAGCTIVVHAHVPCIQGELQHDITAGCHASGLPEALWAAAVPQNYQRRVSQLLEDIHGDHSYMVWHALTKFVPLCLYSQFVIINSQFMC